MHSQNKILIFLVISLAFVVVSCGYLTRKGTQNDLRVVFLDVGQGDAILISQGSDQILIDGGRDGNMLLERLGFFMPFWDRRIEAVIATHYDADHIAGLTALQKVYSVGTVLTSDVSSNSELADFFQSNVHSTKTRRSFFGQGGNIQFASGARLEILWPFVGQQGNSDSNEFSMVSKLTYANHSFLFLADIPEKIESRFLEIGPVDVFKVAHHGSKYSTGLAILEALHPSEAVISVGKNRYGHPSPEVINRLQASGAHVWRTDREGSVSYVCAHNQDQCVVSTIR